MDSEKVPIRERYRQVKAELQSIKEQNQALQEKIEKRNKKSIFQSITTNAQRDIYLAGLTKIVFEKGYDSVEIATNAIANGNDPEIISTISETSARFEYKMVLKDERKIILPKVL